MTTELAKRVRRTDEQLISDLEREIQRLKTRATVRKVTRSPAIKHAVKAVKAIDAAMSESDDRAMRQALDEARASVVACLILAGVVLPTNGGGASVRRAPQEKAQLAELLLAHIQQHAGQRGEQIAAALRTDATTMRPAMHKLIAEKKVKTRGERRGMQYFAA